MSNASHTLASCALLIVVACHTDPAPDDTDVATTADPLVTCTTGDACAATTPSSAHASWRKDWFYPYGPGALSEDPSKVFGTDEAPAYPEASIPDPTSGGRLMFVATSAVTGTLIPAATAGAARAAAFEVEINGTSATELLDAGELDWIRVWPNEVVAGEPVWVSMHVRAAHFDTDTSIRVRLPTDQGDAFDATVPYATTPVRLTSVAHGDALDRVYVHLHNDDTVAHTVSQVIVDGRDQTDAACLATPTLAPGASAMIEVPLCTPTSVGDAWTVAVTFDDATEAVAGGRVTMPLWPIESWPNDSDCPFPGVNDANFKLHQDAGFDTFFLRQRRPADAPQCAQRDAESLVDDEFRTANIYAFADDGGWAMPEAAWDRTPARMLGDEVDNKSLDELRDTQKMRQMAEESTYWAVRERPIVTYIGASRHRFTGMFAGSADLQGMDFYTSACAPHITDFGAAPPLRGAYDYLRATVRNQEPLPTWLYTQGLGGWLSEPSPSEARVQELSVVAAGGRGLMFFQTALQFKPDWEDTWAAFASLNHDLRGVRNLLRVGAPTGAAHTDAHAIVEALRVPGGLVLVVIGLDTTQGPTDLDCALQRNIPYALADQTIDVSIDLADDLGLADAFEVLNGSLNDVEATVTGRTLHLTTTTSEAVAGRLIVLATDPGLREAVQARLTAP